MSGLRDLGIQHDSTIFCTTLMKKQTFQPNNVDFAKGNYWENTWVFSTRKTPKPPFGDSWAPLDRRRLLLGMEVSCLSNRSGGLFFHILSLLHCVEQQSQIFTLFLPFSFFFRVQSRYCSTLTICFFCMWKLPFSHLPSFLLKAANHRNHLLKNSQHLAKNPWSGLMVDSPNLLQPFRLWFFLEHLSSL